MFRFSVSPNVAVCSRCSRSRQIAGGSGAGRSCRCCAIERREARPARAWTAGAPPAPATRVPTERLPAEARRAALRATCDARCPVGDCHCRRICSPIECFKISTMLDQVCHLRPRRPELTCRCAPRPLRPPIQRWMGSTAVASTPRGWESCGGNHTFPPDEESSRVCGRTWCRTRKPDQRAPSQTSSALSPIQLTSPRPSIKEASMLERWMGKGARGASAASQQLLAHPNRTTRCARRHSLPAHIRPAGHQAEHMDCRQQWQSVDACMPAGASHEGSL